MLRKIVFWLGRKLLSLRYSIEVRGMDKLREKNWDGGIVFLPNHPAEIDPVIGMCLLSPTYSPRPLVVEHFFHMWGAGPFMRFVRALDVPNFETTANEWKRKKADESVARIEESLKKKDNFLIYPSGHLRRSERENIGGSSLVHKLLEDNPDTRVVLMRTQGLWGSSFSRAITGYSPDFWKVLVKGFWTVLKNGIFFVPKRKVIIDLEPAPELPKNCGRLEFNRFLENWYNRYEIHGEMSDTEPAKLVPYSFYNKKDVPKIAKQKERPGGSYDFKVPKDMRANITKKLAQLSGVSEDKITDDAELSSDIGLDSLDIATMHAFLDQEYGVSEIAASELVTVADLFALSLGKMEGERLMKLPEHKRKHKKWPDEKRRKKPMHPDEKTLPEVFLKTCDRMGSAIACGDMITGPITYKRLKMAALLFADILAEKEDERFIGIMLPSSSAAYILVFATLIAGKVPVMLNWTTGKRSLDYAHNLLDLRTIITSRNFLDRVASLEMSEAFEKTLTYLEDVRSSIGMKRKLRALFRSLKSAKKLSRQWKINEIAPQDPAVLLFTSGTETYPKAVPLSHYNILENQKSAMQCIDVKQGDCMYGVLPSFHSFGFSVTGTLPLLFGIKVYYAPDPTDARQMASDIHNWGITVLCLAPSFFQNLFAVADEKQMKSLRLCVSGAEKAPKALFEYVDNLGNGAAFIEGYGITECSPVVTVTPVDKERVGVGQPIPGMELCIINPNSGEKLAQGKEGEVCIHGHSVFDGYMTPSAHNPFIHIDGKRWYRSGDLGRLSEDGSLILSGRIKRFIKIGGEMISLTAVEETIRSESITKAWDPNKGSELSVATAVRNAESNKPEIVVFTTFDLTKEQANKTLREHGFGRIVKISEVRQLHEIPVTGTGKIHLRKLDEMVC